MSKFFIFTKALENYEKNMEETKCVSKKATACVHKNVYTEREMTVCVDCGAEIERHLSKDKEWRSFGSSDTKRVSDSTGIRARKNEDRGIYKDVEKFGFDEAIVREANKMYKSVTKGNICRGNNRTAIIFACIFQAFKIANKPVSLEKLIEAFNLDRKNGLKGLKHVSLNAPKNSPIITTYITPVNHIEEIMDKCSATEEHKNEVRTLYKKIYNRSSKLNRSKPQSVAAGLIYYWLCITKRPITLQEFASKVSLSELTINKIAKEICVVLKTPNVI